VQKKGLVGKPWSGRSSSPSPISNYTTATAGVMLGVLSMEEFVMREENFHEGGA